MTEGMSATSMASRSMRQTVTILQLVAGFFGPPKSPESRREAGFSAAVPGSGKIQFSGGLEWLEAAVGKRFPRNWGSDCLNNLSYRTYPPAAVGQPRS